MSGAGVVPGLVSVITPVFNRYELLLEAVASVEAQTYAHVELVLVDDGSTDTTGELCDRLAAEKPALVRALHQANGGPGVARETGRRAARGEFIQYLDSDDLLLPRKLEWQVAALRARPEAGVAYGYTRFRRMDGTVADGPWKGSGTERDTMFPWFLTERWWDTPNPLYRRTVCDAAGPWLPLRQEEDWEYDCRIAGLGTKLVHVKDYVAEVRDHHGSRLSRGRALDGRRCADRYRAHREVLRHAYAAGIEQADPHMKRYARELFLLSRQCGAAGLAAESRELFRLAREASGSARSAGLDFRLYRVVAAMAGWRVAGTIACWADLFRRREQAW
jgi:glycosyltransferase involved in cell wall biosynthesis